MGRLLLLVSKDLKRKLRAPVGLAVLLAFPIVFAGMLALVFGSGGENVPKVRLLVENRDDGFLASALASAFTSKQMAEHFDVRTMGKGKGGPAIEAGEGSALLVLPEHLTQDVLDGKPVTLELVRNPAEAILPEVAEQLARILAEVLDGGAHVLREPLDQLRPYLQEGSKAPSDASIVDLSIAIKRTIEGAEGYLFPPVITLKGAFATATKEEKEREEERGTGSLIFLAVLPGVGVYALFLVADNGMRDVLTEGTLGTMRRQLAGPIGTGTLLAGKALYSGTLALGALAIFSGVAAVFLRTRPSIPGYLGLSLALILAVVGTSALVYGLAGTERKGATFASALYLVMGFLGGSFVSVDNLPKTMQTIAHFTPFYWATSGYRTLLEKGGGLTDVLPAIVVLSILGVVLLLAGTFFLRRTVARGGAAA
jgi:ABC-2 type transport system permease protein